jgi:hypothetical protein
MSVDYLHTGLSNCDTANLPVTASRLRLVQRLRRACAASNNENSLPACRSVVCTQDVKKNIIQSYNNNCGNVQEDLNYYRKSWIIYANDVSFTFLGLPMYRLRCLFPNSISGIIHDITI